MMSRAFYGTLFQAMPFNRTTAVKSGHLPNIDLIPIYHRADSSTVNGTNPTGHRSKKLNSNTSHSFYFCPPLKRVTTKIGRVYFPYYFNRPSGFS